MSDIMPRKYELPEAFFFGEAAKKIYFTIKELAWWESTLNCISRFSGISLNQTAIILNQLWARDEVKKIIFKDRTTWVLPGELNNYAPLVIALDDKKYKCKKCDLITNAQDISESSRKCCKSSASIFHEWEETNNE
jgi:hypothetical protein